MLAILWLPPAFTHLAVFANLFPYRACRNIEIAGQFVNPAADYFGQEETIPLTVARLRFKPINLSFAAIALGFSVMLSPRPDKIVSATSAI